MLKRRRMRKLMLLLACIMLVLTGVSSMSHAAEVAGGSFAGLTFEVHAPGDGDEVPADGDASVPHHHGVCHGHDVGHPARTVEPQLSAVADAQALVLPAQALVATDQRVALRPPQA